MLRGEKKKRSPKMWSQKQNQLRKLRDREREHETKLVRRGGPSVDVAEPDNCIFSSREDPGWL